MADRMSRAERWLLGAVRVLVSLSFAVLVFTAPVVLGVTVYASATGYAGAALSGLSVPVGVDVELPAGVGTDGLARVTDSVPVGSLPVPYAVAGAVLYAVPIVLVLLGLNRLLHLSRVLTGPGRFERDIPRDVRTLAGWVLGAGASFTVLGTVGSFVATGFLADPRVHPHLDIGPLLLGAALAALLVVVTAVLRSGVELQTDHDLTV